MMAAQQQGYRLKEMEPRDAIHKYREKDRLAGKPPRPAPSPMPDDKVKDGWTSSTCQELLDTPDMLRSRVRDCRRAYLVVPDPTKGEKKSNDFRGTEGLQWGDAKRKRAGDDIGNQPYPRLQPPMALMQMQAPHFPYSVPQPGFAQPGALSGHGTVLQSAYLWNENAWRHTYATGLTVQQPAVSE